MNFKRYNGRTWETVRHKRYGSGTDSLTAFPAMIQASGEALTDYLISGNAVQDGTPSPDAPVDVVGCGVRTGNLWDEDYTGISGTLKYVPLFVGEGTFTLSTDAPNYLGNAPLFLLSGNVTSGASTTKNGVYNGVSRTTDSSNGYITIAFRRQSESSDPITQKTMLNLGSTALPYEPYGYKLPLTVNGTEHPIYLGQVKTTRKIYKMRLLDPLSSTATANGYRLTFSISAHRAPSSQSGGGMCTITTWNSNYNQVGFAVAGQYAYITQNISEWATIEGATQWFKENEVYIWYSLANPETGIINEPLHKIGDYADTITMAQAGVTIPTSDGDNTISFGTTVQPSAMSAAFKGWHPVQGAKQYDGSEWR